MRDIVIADRQYMSTAEAASLWNCDSKDVSAWCRKGFIQGATQEKARKPWKIPSDAIRPMDKKLLRELLWQILEKKNDSNCRMDLSIWGVSNKNVREYLSTLISNQYIATTKENVDSMNDIFLTRKSFEILKRHTSKDGDLSDVMLLTSECAGRFAGAFCLLLLGD